MSQSQRMHGAGYVGAIVGQVSRTGDCGTSRTSGTGETSGSASRTGDCGTGGTSGTGGTGETSGKAG